MIDDLDDTIQKDLSVKTPKVEVLELTPMITKQINMLKFFCEN